MLPACACSHTCLHAAAGLSCTCIIHRYHTYIGIMMIPYRYRVTHHGMILYPVGVGGKQILLQRYFPRSDTQQCLSKWSSFLSMALIMAWTDIKPIHISQGYGICQGCLLERVTCIYMLLITFTCMPDILHLWSSGNAFDFRRNEHRISIEDT